jgi:hypothetical protein
VRPTLPGHRKFLRLGRVLGSNALALGHLELIWHAANETGDPIIGDADDVEILAQWQGERGALVKALLECGSAGGAGFIDAVDGGRYAVHDYAHHAPDYVRKRAAREEERRKRVLSGTNDRSAADSDRTLTGQRPPNGSTPAPAPAPAQEKEHSPLAVARVAPVADATPDSSPTGRFALNGKSNGHANGHDTALHQQIIAAYHELCPGMPRVKEWNERRRRKLNARIRERVKAGRPASTVEYWRQLFEKASGSDFLGGRSKTEWRCPGIEWLLEPKNFTKLIEGAYDNLGGGGR